MRSLAIPTFRGIDFQHLAFVIYSTPEIVRLAVDSNEHLVQVPAPLGIQPMMNASFPDLASKHRTKPIPPQPHRLVADIDPAFEQQIFDLPQ